MPPPLAKLSLFSLALAAAPAAVYRAAVNGRLDALAVRLTGAAPSPHARLTLAGLGAVLAVNAVLLAYVAMALLESPGGGSAVGGSPTPPPTAADKKTD